MQTLWQGMVDLSRIKTVITLSGAQRTCRTTFPAIPSDETPGDALYTVIWGDEGDDCDQTNYNHTYIEGAEMLDMNTFGADAPYCHKDMRIHPDVFEEILASLLGQQGGN